jgi:hypothetical protein
MGVTILNLVQKMLDLFSRGIFKGIQKMMFDQNLLDDIFQGEKSICFFSS